MTDFDIRFYIFELLKVSARPRCFPPPHSWRMVAPADRASAASIPSLSARCLPSVPNLRVVCCCVSTGPRVLSCPWHHAPRRQAAQRKLACCMFECPRVVRAACSCGVGSASCVRPTCPPHTHTHDARPWSILHPRRNPIGVMLGRTLLLSHPSPLTNHPHFLGDD